MLTILREIGRRKMPTAREALQMLRAWVDSKAIEAVTVRGRMETIGFNSKIFICSRIAIGRLNAFERVNNWTVRLAGLNHLCNCCSFRSELTFDFRRQLNLFKVFSQAPVIVLVALCDTATIEALRYDRVRNAESE